jgi:hypothetical protein
MPQYLLNSSNRALIAFNEQGCLGVLQTLYLRSMSKGTNLAFAGYSRSMSKVRFIGFLAFLRSMSKVLFLAPSKQMRSLSKVEMRAVIVD